MTHTTCDWLTEHYRDRAQEYQRALDQHYEREERQRAERRRQREQDYEDSLRRAGTWPEALRKAKILYQREADFAEPEGVNEPSDDLSTFFRGAVKACTAALELWAAEEAAVAPQIAELQRQIDAVRSEVARSVSARLRLASQDVATTNLAQALHDIPEHRKCLTEWLSW